MKGSIFRTFQLDVTYRNPKPIRTDNGHTYFFHQQHLLALAADVGVPCHCVSVYQVSCFQDIFHRRPAAQADADSLCRLFRLLHHGNYFGLPIQDAIANTRAIGAVLAGIIGGPCWERQLG